MTLKNMNISIEDLVACKPEAGNVPFFDGLCRSYTARYTQSQQILDCLVGEELGFDSHSFSVGTGNDVTFKPGPLNNAYTGATLTGTVLGFGNLSFDLKSLLNTSYYISDGNNNYQIFNHQNLRWVGQDGLHFDVTGGNIDIGLPTPVAQYMTPGRCTATTELTAAFTGKVHDMVADVTIVALNPGVIGNIILYFDGIKTVNQVIADRNAAHPNNQVALTVGVGTDIPINKEEMSLVGGRDGISCLPGEYMPNNKWLVLTWDCITNQAQWMPPQCCLQMVSFTDGNIEITTGSRDNTTIYCGTCSSTHQGGGSCHCHGPEPLPSINTDNQKLSLTLNSPVSELLCLTRRHGGTLGIQIPDPDSCVDLININEHKLDLQNNLLYILGSDGLINDVVDLSQANLHKIGIVVDAFSTIAPAHSMLSIYNSTNVLNNSIDLWHINEHSLQLYWNTLSILGSDSSVNNTVDLTHVNQHTLGLVGQTLSIYDSGAVETDSVDLDSVAPETLSVSGRNLCIEKIADHQGICCAGNCIDLSSYNFTCADVSSCVCDTPIDRVAVHGVPATLTEYLDPHGEIIAEEALDARHDFFAEPRTMCALMYFVSLRQSNILLVINKISSIQARQKYWAKITMSNPLSDISGHSNQRFWSEHSNAGIPYDSILNARWFVPNFDLAAGRRSQTTNMVDPALAISADTSRLKIPGAPTPLDMLLGTGYNVAPSTNNYEQNGVTAGTQAQSYFSQFGSRTINIPYSGVYDVQLQGVMQVDHNVHAFRYCVARYNALTLKVDLLIDSKFGGGSAAGSGSVNDPLIPRTNEYNLGGSKLIALNRGDILFPLVKIDPRTIWPKYESALATKDLLQELDLLPVTEVALGTPYYGHTYHSATTYSFTPGIGGGSITQTGAGSAGVMRDHPATTIVPDNKFPRPTSNLPNITPHFFGPNGGESGAGNYGFNLVYPGGVSGLNGTGHAIFDEYRRDDGSLTLYGPSSRFNSDGDIGFMGDNINGGASLSVTFVNTLQ